MPNQSRTEPRIRHAIVDSLCIFEVTEDELTILEHGSPQSTLLAISIALISIAISFLITILTTTIKEDRTYNFFLFTTIICFSGGIILLIIWWFMNRGSTPVIKKIRNRLQNETSATDTATDPTIIAPSSQDA
jgi:hypothetical protein